MARPLFRLVLVALVLMSFSKDRLSYQIFTAKGKKANYGDLIKAAKDADVVLFGEEHNNPMSHWLQLELTRDLYDEVGDRLCLGAEMFESDEQVLLSEYVDGLVSTRSFEGQARLWNNYKTDYKPLVELAVENDLNFVATNIPRRYASAVYMGGLEALEGFGDDAKSWIAPLPIEVDTNLRSYREMLEMGGGHGGWNLVYAQAVKDATMAYFILKNMKEESLFIHYNGAFHNKYNEGITWYLKQARPELRVVTISTQSQAEIDTLSESNEGVADFIIAVPENMTKTY
jgi:uncharacterized iron-regulated protein